MTKLRLAEWASLAEIVSAVAVVISLIYVGMQVSDNTAEIRAGNRQEMVGRAHQATISVATSPELAESFARAVNQQDLTTAQQNEYGFFVRAMLYDVQEAFLLHREGRLDEGYWATREALYRTYMQQQFARGIYSRNKSLGLLHREFVAWADSVFPDSP